MSARSRVLVVAALVAVVLAAFVAARVVFAPIPHPLERAAAADARVSALNLRTGLTLALEGMDGATQPDVVAALDEVVTSTDPVVAFEPVDAENGEAAWRVQLAGGAYWGSGFLARGAEAVVCVTVTVDRKADPPVHMVDAPCLSDPSPESSQVRVDPPERPATNHAAALAKVRSRLLTARCLLRHHGTYRAVPAGPASPRNLEKSEAAGLEQAAGDAVG